ncbi:migration and invasion enhancer 1-like, partial [Pocillopora damicornis]|uniref:migration and invasion enhancer 1-like n=1 Tax=Pocillopora damicornis TaxID=46731 RepID=UPI000F54CA27
GYAPRYRELADKIKADVPEANVVGQVGRTSSFEVMVNGKLIFSKLEQGSFPSFKEIVVVVRDCSQGKEPCEVTEKEESSCILL